jgi:endonuclease-3
MARESEKKLSKRVETLIKELRKHYPHAHCALHHRNPFELLLATMLSAQCTDEKVNQVTATLFAKYKNPKDFAEAQLAELELEVRPTGFFKTKARALKTAAQVILDDYRGQVPQTMEELIKLPGVGRKTANVVLGNAFNIPTGVVVDTHVARLSYRLGLTNYKAPVKIELDLQDLLPKQEWIHFSHLLIFHGRAICRARRPLCETCFLAPTCPKRGVALTPLKGRVKMSL